MLFGRVDAAFSLGLCLSFQGEKVISELSTLYADHFDVVGFEFSIALVKM